MFEELDKNLNAENARTSPGEDGIEDMFSGFSENRHESYLKNNDNKARPSVFTPISPANTVRNEAPGYENKGVIAKKIIIISGFLLVFILMLGGYWVVSKYLENSGRKNSFMEQADGTKKSLPEPENQDQIIPPAQEAEAEDQSILAGTADDEIASTTAADGRAASSTPESDARTANLDSDNDGLTDIEETEIYKTDPNIPDSDSDGYLDGNEIDAGYNPLGEGKLSQPVYGR